MGSVFRDGVFVRLQVSAFKFQISGFSSSFFNLMTSRRARSLWFGLMLLVAVTGITIYGVVRQQSHVRYDGLLARLPTASTGWVVKDLPLATSEGVQKAMGEMLNYDQAIFREYRQGNRVLNLYAAYWRPYRFNPRLIAIHVPDVCWKGGGWEMSQPDYAYPVMLAGNQKAWPAQYRLFTREGISQHVLYWHVVEGRLSGFAQGPDSMTYQSTVARFWQGIKGEGAGEQFFIRLSSEQPWSEWQDEPIFKDILGTFAPVLTARLPRS